jgi:receptor tyrosine kinase-like orphan receptor 1
MLETSICRMEYAIAKKHPLIGVVLPTCEALPSAGSKDSVNCLRLGVPNVVQVVHGM